MQGMKKYIRSHWCRLVKNIRWANQKVVKSDECMGVSQLLGGYPPKVYTYVWSEDICKGWSDMHENWEGWNKDQKVEKLSDQRGHP